MQKFKNSKTMLLLLFLLFAALARAQINLDRYEGGPEAVSVGMKYALIGGAIWGGSLLLIILIKKANKDIAPETTFIGKLLSLLCVVGGIIALIGLAMAGF